MKFQKKKYNKKLPKPLIIKKGKLRKCSSCRLYKNNVCILENNEIDRFESLKGYCVYYCKIGK